jgi:hypothetical protein
MLLAPKVLAVVAVAMAMALSPAHVLELPGKMRLSKEHFGGAVDLLSWIYDWRHG